MLRRNATCRNVATPHGSETDRCAGLFWPFWPAARLRASLRHTGDRLRRLLTVVLQRLRDRPRELGVPAVKTEPAVAICSDGENKGLRNGRHVASTSGSGRPRRAHPCDHENARITAIGTLLATIGTLIATIGTLIATIGTLIASGRPRRAHPSNMKKGLSQCSPTPCAAGRQADRMLALLAGCSGKGRAVVIAVRVRIIAVRVRIIAVRVRIIAVRVRVIAVRVRVIAVRVRMIAVRVRISSPSCVLDLPAGLSWPAPKNCAAPRTRPWPKHTAHTCHATLQRPRLSYGTPGVHVSCDAERSRHVTSRHVISSARSPITFVKVLVAIACVWAHPGHICTWTRFAGERDSTARCAAKSLRSSHSTS